ncbi:MAG: DNA-processing protein DprA [Solirubrobacteraceae bacterium]
METAALVALLREGGRAWTSYVLAARQRGTERVSALTILEQELGLLSYEALTRAQQDIEAWQARGFQVLPASDREYPENLRVVENRPPLLFIAGRLAAIDRRAVSVIGTRQPSDTGRALARSIGQALALAGYTVVSGLAAGVDAEAHRAVLDLQAGERARSVRTLAVLGTGLGEVYPPDHAQLQSEVAAGGALVSQFWPDAPPTRNSFPARNAVMSGLTLGSVIVEAGEHSGTRIQARHALTQGRVVVLMPPTMRCAWAAQLAEQPGVVVAQNAADVVEVFKR